MVSSTVSNGSLGRICIITGAHLCRNPRVVKEATALSNAGYEVIVLAPILSKALLAFDDAILAGVSWQRLITADLVSATCGRLKSLWHRIRRRVGRELVYYLGFQAVDALGYGVRYTHRMALKEEADLYIGHQEVGSWVAAKLYDYDRNIGADFEDWYSEDLLPEARKWLPINLLKKCESILLSKGRHVTTTSVALAKGLSEAYKTTEPVVIYNAFPYVDREKIDGQIKDRQNIELPSLHWFSQTIGKGRGLEFLCTALNSVSQPVELHLRGQISSETRSWITQQFPDEKGHRLFFHKLVSQEELLSRIAEHDIGFALEDSIPINKDKTISNKILSYLLAGIAIVATDTAGQVEVHKLAPNAVYLCQNRDLVSLAFSINSLLNDNDALIRAKKEALTIARDEFCWEKQVPKLIDSVREALNPTVA